MINKINIINNNISFGHNNPWADSPYNDKKKYFIATATTIGVIGGMAVNAKCNGYSLNPK